MMKLRKEIDKRIFLVGAARSGTTLLQSLVASHKQIHSFPETHFFIKTIRRSGKKRFLPFFKREHDYVKEFLKDLGHGDLARYLPIITFSVNKWTKALLRILDEVTLRNDKTMWLEKTPIHLHYVDLLMGIVPSLYFMHMIRNGEDVVASMYHATHKHSTEWGGTRTIDDCIERWKKDIAISKKYLGLANHVFVRYEELVETPEKHLRRICEKMDLQYKDSMLEFREITDQIILEKEKWKKGVNKPIQKRSKFKKVFNKKEQKYVLKRVSGISLEPFSYE